jgi:hypothetical protein
MLVSIGKEGRVKIAAMSIFKDYGLKYSYIIINITSDNTKIKVFENYSDVMEIKVYIHKKSPNNPRIFKTTHFSWISNIFPNFQVFKKN